MRSAASGKLGHKQEFILCHESRQPVALAEAEQCMVTGEQVRPGILAICELTGKRVLPSELQRCSVTGKRALKTLLVTSSLSQVRILEDIAIRSAEGTFCTPAEGRACFWSGRISHPDDLRVCALTGLAIHLEFATNDGAPLRLRPPVDLLDGVRRTADEAQLWGNVAARIVAALKGGKCRIEAAVLSPAKRHLATCAEVRTFFGLRVHWVGAVYDLSEEAVIGRLAEGKRNASG
jgi:hypothetical protein